MVLKLTASKHLILKRLNGRKIVYYCFDIGYAAKQPQGMEDLTQMLYQTVRQGAYNSILKL